MRAALYNVTVTVCRRAECSTSVGKNWNLNFMSGLQIFCDGGFLSTHTNTLL